MLIPVIMDLRVIGLHLQHISIAKEDISSTIIVCFGISTHPKPQ